MHPLVRNLYRRALVLGKDYPLEMEEYRRRAKRMFLKNAALEDEIEIRRAVARGRWYLRQRNCRGNQIKKVSYIEK